MTLLDLALTTEPTADNPVRGDLHVEGTALALVRGPDAVAQAVVVELRWWLGEWFLDTRRGVPYVQRILRKGVSPRTVRAIIRRHIERSPGVDRVTFLRLTVDPRTREASIDFELRTTDGQTVSASDVGLGS